MKILVCISHVPDTTSKIQFTSDGKSLDTTGIQFVINPYDEFALTRALWFKEKEGGSVTVVNVGKANTEPTLRKALAIGADDAIRIDAEPTDGFAVASELNSLIATEKYDLVIMGRESIDYNGTQVPGMVAALLDWPFVNACVGMEVEGGVATCIREIDGGKETVKASLPMIVAGQKGLVEEKDLRIPNMRGIMTARTKPLKVIPSISNEVATEAIKFEKPAGKQACKMVSSDDVKALVDLLHNEAKAI
jgi:electron transfer flavoprotein beta subunit